MGKLDFKRDKQVDKQRNYTLPLEWCLSNAMAEGHRVSAQQDVRREAHSGILNMNCFLIEMCVAQVGKQALYKYSNRWAN